MKKYFQETYMIMIILIIYLVPCFSQGLPEGPYIGEEPPGLTPKKFAPNFISTDDRAVQNGSFSPDGKEFCFAVSGVNWHSIIMITRQIDGKWTEPDTISFCRTGINSLCPVHSPDGQKLFFISRARKKYYSADIWVSERIDTGWAEPQRLKEPVNSNADEWEVCISQNNTLYFSSSRPGGYGSLDVYCSKLIEGEYTTIENLGPPINTSTPDECPGIAADESYLFFNSFRSGGYGGNDLYFSSKNSDDSWTRPKNLGSEINTSQLDIYPVLSPDGKYFFFTRRPSASINRSSIYWVDAAKLIESLINPSLVEDSNLSPTQFELYQNYPNPFNPETTINFDLPSSKYVSLKIYDISGCLVKTLANHEMKAGSHSFSWDSRNEAGMQVPSGIYFYSIVAGDYNKTIKMTLMK